MQNFEISFNGNFIATIVAKNIIEAVKYFCKESNVTLDEICFDSNIKPKNWVNSIEVEFNTSYQTDNLLCKLIS